MSVRPIEAASPPETRIRALLDRQRSACTAEGAPSAKQRIDRIDRAIDLLLRHETRLCDAMAQDFGHRSIHQSKLTDIYGSLQSLKHARAHVHRWMRPERRAVGFPLSLGGGRARVEYQPKGVVGAITPWNFPLHLAFTPLAGIFAAGNRVMIKPSEYTPATSELLRELFAGAYDEAEAAVITGDADVGIAFSRQPFDHLIFTGSTGVGRHVMRAAAENLVPVTLELGGKSPTILGAAANLDYAATRIMHGKMLNAGQICLAPDYLYTPEDRRDETLQAMVRAATRLYPTWRDNPDYTSVINQRHFERLNGLIVDAEERGATVVRVDPANEYPGEGHRKIPATFLLDVPDDARVMQEEIFGPVFPIKTYRLIEEVIDYVNARPRPLALYYFGDHAGEQKRVLGRTTSGGALVNDVVYHVACEELPFGGVGQSGMGNYHGREGFVTFSHARSVLRQGPIDINRLLRPPYTKTLERAFPFLIRR